MYIRAFITVVSVLSPVYSSPILASQPYRNFNPGTINYHNMNPTSNVNVNPTSGNPVFPGWYADPEARIFDTTYWIYPTTSTVYEAQTTLDAFSSPDLLTWTRHPHVLNITRIPWSTNRAAWAPSVVAAHNTYYMYFSAGDGAGIGVARSVSGRPDGPFEDAIGKPLVPETIHGAQPIDAQVFIDDDASVWLYFGGWSHAVVVPLASDMVALAGDYKEITPKDYVEGPWVLKRKGVYYFMYSVGGWGDSSYGVSYVTGPSPTGPFSTTPRKILQGDGVVGDSTGHNSVFTPDGGETYYIVYHRRPVGDTERDHRVTCIDRMEFDEEGNILPVKITAEGVEGRLL